MRGMGEGIVSWEWEEMGGIVSEARSGEEFR